MVLILFYYLSTMSIHTKNTHNRKAFTMHNGEEFRQVWTNKIAKAIKTNKGVIE